MKKYIKYIIVLLAAAAVIMAVCLDKPEPEAMPVSETVPGECSLQLGECLSFGQYEQDGDASNGPEPIEWLVVDTNGAAALLVSRYGLDAVQYNTADKKVTWESCSLRRMLNSEFIETAFSEEEQARLLTVSVAASANPYYETDPGSDTVDRVFILGFDEAEKYFKTEADRICTATPYAVSRGVSIHSNGGCRWWLRTPGHTGSYAAYVDCDGFANSPGNYVSIRVDAVRPAIWITG